MVQAGLVRGLHPRHVDPGGKARVRGLFGGARHHLGLASQLARQVPVEPGQRGAQIMAARAQPVVHQARDVFGHLVWGLPGHGASLAARRGDWKAPPRWAKLAFMLNFILHGAPGAQPPLVIAHGLFGSGRNWGVIARRLAEDRPVIAVDMRNHGDSPFLASHSYADLAADLAEVIAAHGGRADVLGHSMGGKAAMQLALTQPDRVRRLIVADIAPVAYGHSQNHLIAAMQAMDLTGLVSRSEADQRLGQAITDPALRAFLLQSLDLRADPVRWKFNLEVLKAEMDAITGWPCTAGRFDGPALFVTGALSDYVRPEHRAGIVAQFPQARFTELEGAGHWLHAERPREFEAALRDFLA